VSWLYMPLNHQTAKFEAAKNTSELASAAGRNMYDTRNRRAAMPIAAGSMSAA